MIFFIIQVGENPDTSASSHIVEDVFSHIDTVDGKILHKLRLVVFPIIYKVLAPGPGSCEWDFWTINSESIDGHLIRVKGWPP